MPGLPNGVGKVHASKELLQETMKRVVFDTWEQATVRAEISGHEYLTVYDVVECWKQLPLVAYRPGDETFHVFEYDRDISWETCGEVGAYITDRRFQLSGRHLPRTIKDEILEAAERAVEQRPDLELKPYVSVHKGRVCRPVRYSLNQIKRWSNR